MDSTYIRMVADLLDHIRVEVTGVTLEALANGEGVLHATKDLSNDIVNDATLAQLDELITLGTIVVNGLDPAVVLRGSRVIDMVLELDDVRVRNVVGIDRAQDRSRVAMDSLGTERGRLGDGRQRQSSDAPHGDGNDSVRLPEAGKKRRKEKTVQKLSSERRAARPQIGYGG